MDRLSKWTNGHTNNTDNWTNGHESIKDIYVDIKKSRDKWENFYKWTLDKGMHLDK